MRDRQNHIQLVAIVHPPEQPRGPRAEQKILVSQHHPLRRARRAGRIDQHGDLFCPIGLDRFRDRRFIELSDADIFERADVADVSADASGMIGRFRRDARTEEHPAGAAVIADLVQFARRQSRVHDNSPGIDGACSQQKPDKRNAVLADDHHAVARTNAEVAQRCRDQADVDGKLPIGPAFGVLDQRGMIRRLRHATRHGVMQPVRQAIQNVRDTEFTLSTGHIILPAPRAGRFSGGLEPDETCVLFQNQSICRDGVRRIARRSRFECL